MLKSHIQQQEISKYIEKAIELAEMGIEESRRLSHAVAPGFGGMDLRHSLCHLVDNLNISSSIVFECHPDIDVNPPDEIAINIYRIAQEAINNIVAHSEAKHASIELYEKNANLILEVKDDGKGLEDGSYPKSMENLGFTLMKTRATKLNGVFEAFSDPEKGTLIRVRVPLNLESIINKGGSDQFNNRVE